MEVKGGPLGLAVDEKNQRLLVLNYSDGTLAVIKEDDFSLIKRIPLNKKVDANLDTRSVAYDPGFNRIYIATGQDAAHVVEGSMGITTTKLLQDEALYIGVYLPAIMLGTVGGGTGLQTQQEALRLIGVKKSPELAEVVGGAVLAGELSLLASEAEGSLGDAHCQLRPPGSLKTLGTLF